MRIPLMTVLFVADIAMASEANVAPQTLGVQFALHATAPIQLGASAARDRLWKWEDSVTLAVQRAESSALPLASLNQGIDAAGSALETALALDLVRGEHLIDADIVLATYDPSASSAGLVTQQVLESTGRAAAAAFMRDSGYALAADPDACRTFLFDDAADDAIPAPFVVIALAEGPRLRRGGDELIHCLFEELGHAMTFFADIPLSFPGLEGSAPLQFNTIYDAEGEQPNGIVRFTQSDFALMELLKDPALKHGMPLGEAIALVATRLGL